MSNNSWIITGVVACLLFVGVIAVAGSSSDNSESESSPTTSEVVATPAGPVHQQVDVKSALPFGETEVPDSNQPVGYRMMLSEGTPGELTVAYDVVTSVGQEIGRAEINRVVSRQPVNRRVAVGTYVPPAPQPGPRYGAASGDLDCADVSYDEAQYWVAQGDPHGFDGDGDGEGCEGNR